MFPNVFILASSTSKLWVDIGLRGEKEKMLLNPLPDNKILDRSQLKQSADDNFKFNENSRKFSKWVENTVDKGEIARYEQFLLFPQCFQKAYFPGASKGVIVWEWVNSLFSHIQNVFTTSLL